MPELPEVETTRRGLRQKVLGQKIAQVQVRRYDLRWPIPQDLGQRLTGATIRDIRRRAKYLLIDLDTGESLLAHLGMSGSFVVNPGKPAVVRPHDHVIIGLENGATVVFHDPRRFGMMDVLPAGGEAGHALLKDLGPEPLGEAFDAAYLSAALKRRTGPIKPTLMDQKLVVGVGNIYASESLYLSGVSPELPAHKLAPKSAEIVAAIQATLKAAIDSGGSSLRDYVGTGSELGYFQHHFHVYGRDGEPCNRCGASIESMVQAGRATYWCPRCQPKRISRQKT